MTDTDMTQDREAKRPSLTIDWQLYASMLDGSDWSDDQKKELIETLWSITLHFVDMGFDVGTGDVAAFCGEPSEDDDSDAARMLSSSQHHRQQEQPHAADPDQTARRRSPAWD